MEGFKEFRESLGIGQRKMASLIGVSRSQLSLYELGMRSLPTSAMMLLGEMFMHFEQSPKEPAKSSGKEDSAKRKFLEQRIAEIKFQQLKLDKKIDDARKKIELAASQLRLSDFNQSQLQKGKALPGPPLNLVTGTAARTLDSPLSFELYKEGLTQKILAFELELLEHELESLVKSDKLVVE